MRLQQAVDQRLKPVGLLDDHLRVLAQLALIEFELQQLRCAANPAQRVLDLMRQIADELLVHQRLVDDPLFALVFELLLVLDQLDDHEIGRCLGRRHDSVRVQRLLRGALEHQIEARRLEVIGNELHHRRRQHLAVREDIVPRHLRERATRERQQRLGRRIGENDTQRMLLQHQQHGRQRFKTGQNAGRRELGLPRIGDRGQHRGMPRSPGGIGRHLHGRSAFGDSRRRARSSRHRLRLPFLTSTDTFHQGSGR